MPHTHTCRCTSPSWYTFPHSCSSHHSSRRPLIFSSCTENQDISCLPFFICTFHNHYFTVFFFTHYSTAYFTFSLRHFFCFLHAPILFHPALSFFYFFNLFSFYLYYFPTHRLLLLLLLLLCLKSQRHHSLRPTQCYPPLLSPFHTTTEHQSSTGITHSTFSLDQLQTRRDIAGLSLDNFGGRAFLTDQ